MAFGVGGAIERPHVLRGVAAGDLLALEAGDSSRVEYVLLVPVDPHHPVRVALQEQFPGPVVHLPCAGDGHVMTNEKALRCGGHMGGDAVPVVG